MESVRTADLENRAFVAVFDAMPATPACEVARARIDLLDPARNPKVANIWTGRIPPLFVQTGASVEERSVAFGAKGVVETEMARLAAQASRSTSPVPADCAVRVLVAIQEVALVRVREGEHKEKEKQEKNVETSHDG